MGRLRPAEDDMERLWRMRFGEPPPVRTSAELTRSVLEAHQTGRSARLSLEAALLEREAERACRT